MKTGRPWLTRLKLLNTVALLTLHLLPTPVVVEALVGRSVVSVTLFVCLSVCLCIGPLKGKRLELPRPKSVGLHTYSMAGYRHTLTRKSKAQRSKYAARRGHICLVVLSFIVFVSRDSDVNRTSKKSATWEHLRRRTVNDRPSQRHSAGQPQHRISPETRYLYRLWCWMTKQIVPYMRDQ